MKHADLGLNLTTKRTRKRDFLGEMEGVVAQMPVAAEVGSGDERDELGSG